MITDRVTRLRALIEQHGLTHEETAQLLHVSRAAVRSWLYGQRPLHERYLELLEMKLENRRRT